ncbi:hypothetical protein [Amycolatopsis regifaucium]|uniref:DUF4164 family protein n=1 Tax=Amycolatopsis regifaucium TaxID=546365 RepID=A0ABX3DH78_9PSEU|nr:hypothetical protein [Amycolatopsis regifaucium]OKA03357.1 hypothetical protein ATP06_0236750 [Amycolatopsis regifaucium]SFJ67723.1 hypothetical protein SAMN04489731_13013 [Amycolatopsis regifaucium]
MADENLAQRVARLERQVAELSERSADSAAARVLAAGADRDVAEVRAELRAHTGTLNALREDQVDLRDDVRGLREEMRQGFSTVTTSLGQIIELLDRDNQTDE